MIIAVASGKGGTGKTTIAVNLALALEYESKNVKFFDCDVEASNAYLFLKPQINHSEPVMTAYPTVDGTRCTFCGKCAEVCAFHALAVVKDRVLLFPELCHDCGGCEPFCPQKAIGKKEHKIGLLESGYAGNIAFFQGRLTPGEVFFAASNPGAKAHGDRGFNRHCGRHAGYFVPCRRSARGE
jgi:MinD superfamily P-loop ATPase